MGSCAESFALKNDSQQFLIGITGGIGSGKSRVCQYLADLCQLPCVSLDIICRDLLAIGAPGSKALLKELGTEFFSASGELDRSSFRAAIFADSQLRQRVDKLLHPLARQEMLRKVANYGRVVLVEIPLLFEAGWQKDVDCIVVVSAASEVCCQRVVLRDSVSKDQVLQAISAQQSLEDKALQANVVIDNSGSWKYTCRQVQKLANELLHDDFFKIVCTKSLDRDA